MKITVKQAILPISGTIRATCKPVAFGFETVSYELDGTLPDFLDVRLLLDGNTAKVLDIGDYSSQKQALSHPAEEFGIEVTAVQQVSDVNDYSLEVKRIEFGKHFWKATYASVAEGLQWYELGEGKLVVHSPNDDVFTGWLKTSITTSKQFT